MPPPRSVIELVVRTLKFPETFQRSDNNATSLIADYPIGENIELVMSRPSSSKMPRQRGVFSGRWPPRPGS